MIILDHKSSVVFVGIPLTIFWRLMNKHVYIYIWKTEIACLPILMAKVMQYGDETLRNSFILHCLFTFALSLSIQQLPTGKPSYPHPFYHQIPFFPSPRVKRWLSQGIFVKDWMIRVKQCPRCLSLSKAAGCFASADLDHWWFGGQPKGEADALEMGWGWDVGCFCVFVCVVWSEFLIWTVKPRSFQVSILLLFFITIGFFGRFYLV